MNNNWPYTVSAHLTCGPTRLLNLSSLHPVACCVFVPQVHFVCSDAREERARTVCCLHLFQEAVRDQRRQSVVPQHDFHNGPTEDKRKNKNTKKKIAEKLVYSGKGGKSLLFCRIFWTFSPCPHSFSVCVAHGRRRARSACFWMAR